MNEQNDGVFNFVVQMSTVKHLAADAALVSASITDDGSGYVHEELVACDEGWQELVERAVYRWLHKSWGIERRNTGSIWAFQAEDGDPGTCLTWGVVVSGVTAEELDSQLKAVQQQ